jgi:hypothetical protein
MKGEQLIERLCNAYAWQRARGHATAQEPTCRIVWDREHPDVWDANHVSDVRAATAAEIDTVLRRAGEALAHCGYRLFAVDPLTPPALVARLALDDYRELPPAIQLVLDGDLRATPRDIDLRAIATDADWDVLHTLVRRDHAEGTRTHGRRCPTR